MDVNSRQTVECTLFASAFETKTPVAATLGGYLDEVKNGKHKPQVDLLRAYLSAGESEKATATKKKLPLLVAGGVMAGGRKLEHMVRYSGCVVGDLDHVPGSPAQLLCRARELPYVKAGHISPSGTGLKLFVLVDSDLEHHAQAFMLVSRMLEVDLPGVQVDPSGKDPNRGCFAGYDPDAFYKEVAEVVQVPVCNEPLPASARRRSWARWPTSTAATACRTGRTCGSLRRKPNRELVSKVAKIPPPFLPERRPAMAPL